MLSWVLMQAALVTARNVYGNEAAREYQVLEAAAGLWRAIEGLVVAAAPPPVCREDLREAISEAESRVQGNYTVMSWLFLHSSLVFGRNVYGDETAREAQVLEAARNLWAMIEGLVDVGRVTGGAQNGFEWVDGFGVDGGDFVGFAEGSRVSQGLVTVETTVYSYDDNGNQLSRVTTVVRPSGLAALLDLVTPSGVTPLANTAVGTAARRPESEISVYNVFNQLIRTETEHHVAYYVYLPNGLRHSKSVGGRGIGGSETVIHVWCGAFVIAEMNTDRVIVNRFVRGFGMELIRSHHHGFYIHNARGDVVQRVDENGDILHTYRYTAFGVELNPCEENNNVWRFNGEYKDFETGRQYLRARSYDPLTGRMTSEDPYWGIHNMTNCVASIMQSGNLYVYVMNNPIF